MVVVASPPLAHLRVVDVTDLRGALVGRMLAELGADVVKVEPPDGDPERRCGDPRVFLVRHAGKRGACIDPATADGRARLAALCDAADVLVENLGPAGQVQYELEPSAVRRRHPHLVHVAVADCGLRGPRAHWRLEPLPALAASGALFASGPASGAPCGTPGFLAHDCAAVIAAAGALAALSDRRRTDDGQTIEVSVEEAALAALAPWGIPLVDYRRAFPVLPHVMPRDDDGPALVVPVADGFVRLLAVTPHQWRALAALLAGDLGEAASGVPTSADRHDAAGLLRRLAARGEHLARLGVGALARLPLPGTSGALPVLQAGLALVRRVATAALRHRTRAEVLAAGLRLRLPVAPVLTPAEFVAAEQTSVRGAFVSTGFPGLGDTPVAVFPCRLSRTPAALRRPAPAPGEQSGFDGPRTVDPPTGGAARGLVGVRVVDLGVGIVGPELCRHLAELGADVVKIEPVETLDFLRRLTVDPARTDHAWPFNDADRGRRSVQLDLRTAEGRERALSLCAAADVVVENRTAGVVERWGLDEAAVRARRPDVIYVSSQGYGRGGPLGAAPSFGPLVSAYAGVSWLWSPEDGDVPIGTALEHPDHFAGRLLAVAVLAALEHRTRTGEGQYVECSQSEAAAYPLAACYLPGAPVVRGNGSDTMCPHGVYPAAGDDRWIAIAVRDDAAWERLRALADWPADPTLATLAGRQARRQSLDARLAEWTRGRDAMDATATLQAAGVSAMPVQGPHELRADVHLAARGALVVVDDPDIGPVHHVGAALRATDTPAGAAGPAPRLGAHTDEVLSEWLGIR